MANPKGKMAKRGTKGTKVPGRRGVYKLKSNAKGNKLPGVKTAAELLRSETVKSQNNNKNQNNGSEK